MNEYIYAAALLTPALVLVLLFWRGTPALYLLIAAAIVLPASVFIWPPSNLSAKEPPPFDPVAAWGKGECVGKHGVGLLMRDTRVGSQPRWWVMCRDGSKAAVVTYREFPVPADRFEPSSSDFV